MSSKNLLFLLPLVITTACISQNNFDNNDKITEIIDSVILESYFCPQDNCEEIMKKVIESSQNSAYCAFFDLELKGLITVIAKKSKEADVKVVIDKNNYENQIKGPGIKIANSKQYMHNKFCIIDESIVFTGSTNPTKNGVKYNNNNLIVINSKYLAKNYLDEFDELWNGIYTSGEKVKYEKIISENLIIENYFCPEDNCKERVIDTLKQAEENIYFMTFSFTDEEIADEILFKNIDVKGIFENRGSGTDYSQYNRLKDFGIDVKKDKNKKTMHHKVFIIDKKTVITGSMNPTGSGNFRNDENILIIHNKETASRFLKEFNELWR